MTSAPPPSLPTTTALPRTFWWACALATPPIATLAVRLGYGVALEKAWQALGLLVLASIAEEIVFRGGLLRLLRRRAAGRAQWHSISAANALVSAVFSLAHLWNHPPLAALGMLPVSLVLGWAYERSGERLAAPILLHLYFNLALFAASLAMR